ncbi:MAG TPA: histidine kinase dimerization/phospho-acceptor domain-containing protein [Myxococcota bacterium]|nr:histidine kinase dimerization/phospho-acceptor domain-containing protein [Myxococcota bacterium]
MTQLWIVHRLNRERSALARLAGAHEAVLGAPGDAHFDVAPKPDVVVLGLEGDWEPELEFAHGLRRRAPHARWILVGPRRADARALSLFDAVVAEYLPYPPDASQLRARIAATSSVSAPPTLSERSERDLVSARFGRWFADLELPALLRALDPTLADVPVRIAGEPGTGRGLLVRYLHWFGGPARGAMAHVPCTTETRSAEIEATLSSLGRGMRGVPLLLVWLEDFDRLSPVESRRVAGWVASGLPAGFARPPVVRWVGTCADDEPESPQLYRALGGIALRIPPLRERAGQIARLVDAAARAWCAARGARPRRFGEDAIAVMEEYPWPGNLLELESLVVETLAAGAADPIRADDLVRAGEPFAALPVTRVGTLLAEDEAAPEPLELAEVDAEIALDHLAEPAEPPHVPASVDPPVHPSGSAEGALARLVGALSHEVRNPLATIRTFAELLPHRFQDPEFRDRFAEMVRDDVGRIDALVERLAGVADLGRPKREKLDLTALLEELLAERRDAIRRRSLLVLKELETNAPQALGDREQLRVAFDALLGKCLEWVPERGDVYIASRHHAAGLPSEGSMRVLLRFHTPGATSSAPGVSIAETSLDLMIAEIIVRAQGGDFAVAATDGEETLIVVDLPAPTVA